MIFKIVVIIFMLLEFCHGIWVESKIIDILRALNWQE